MKKSLLVILLFSFFTANAQVGIGTNTPNASAKLDITSTNKGFLPPRVALTGTADVSTIASPATALLVYNTATAGISPNNVIPGYYYYNGTNWINIITSATTGVPYSGATGAVNLGAYDLTVNGLTVGLGAGTNSTSVASGQGSLRVNTTGTENIAGGFQSLYSNTTGTNNSANGAYALQGNTIGNRNTASGSYSLISNTTGTHNSAIGYTSLYGNISGGFNTASGVASLSANTTGDFNTATGRNTLITNTTGSNNTAIGNGADVASAALTNATAIGNGAVVNASNKIQLGNTSVTSVATSGKLTTGAITLPNTDGTNGQVLSTNGSGVVGWNSYLPSLATVVEAFGLTLSASNSGNIIHTQHTAHPIFPENLPDGFNCTLVNYSNSAGPSTTLTSTKFYSTVSGNAGSASFTIKVGGSVKVNVVTIGGIKKYYVSGDIQ